MQVTFKIFIICQTDHVVGFKNGYLNKRCHYRCVILFVYYSANHSLPLLHRRHNARESACCHGRLNGHRWIAPWSPHLSVNIWGHRWRSTFPDTKTLGLGFALWLYWRSSIPQTTRHYEDLKHLAVNSVVAWRQIPLQSVLAESVYYL